MNPDNYPTLSDMRSNPTNAYNWEYMLDSMDPVSLSEFYELSHHGELEPGFGEDVFWSGGVGWIGDKDRMVRVKAKYCHSIFGNVFDPRKLKAVQLAIQSGQQPIFRAAYGIVGKIDLYYVAESIAYAEDNHWDRPYTTGDEELDEYIVRVYEEGEDEEYAAAGSGFEDIEDARLTLEQAFEEQWGDIGELEVQVRDGNHRVMGAILAGVEYIWILESEYSLRHRRRSGPPEG